MRTFSHLDTVPSVIDGDSLGMGTMTAAESELAKRVARPTERGASPFHCGRDVSCGAASLSSCHAIIDARNTRIYRWCTV
jgi:hypothetical protein